MLSLGSVYPVSPYKLRFLQALSGAFDICLTARCTVAPFGLNGYSRARQLLLQRTRNRSAKILIFIPNTHPAGFSPNRTMVPDY